MADPTLLIHWIFSCLALLVIFTRLIWRRTAGQGFNTGDYLTMGAALCALARLAIIHVVLTWGTNNVSSAYRLNHDFTPQEIYRREVGSKLALVNRLFYNSYLWLHKLVLLDVYRRLIRNLPYERPAIWGCLVVFFGSYVAVQVTTFSECVPVQLYWQVVPDPGECARAQVQLFVVGILNIVTDVMLLVLPLPILFAMQTATWRRRAQLLVLFTLGIFVIAITVIRLPINSSHADSQVNRTTWASTELLVAAIVVNAPTLWGLCNKKRQESQRARSTGKSGSGGGGGGTGRATGTSSSGTNLVGSAADRSAGGKRGSRFYGLGHPKTGGGGSMMTRLDDGAGDCDELVLGDRGRSTSAAGRGGAGTDSSDEEEGYAGVLGNGRGARSSSVLPPGPMGIKLTREVIVTRENIDAKHLDGGRRDGTASSRSSQKGILKD